MRDHSNDMLKALFGYPSKLLRLDEISITQLSPNSANHLRRNQIRGAIKQMRVFLAGTTFFCASLVASSVEYGRQQYCHPLDFGNVDLFLVVVFFAGTIPIKRMGLKRIWILSLLKRG